MRSFRLTFLLLGFATFSQAEPLSGTLPLDSDESDFSPRIMAGAHELVERLIEEAESPPPSLLAPQQEREDANQRSREALRQKLGVVDKRLAPRIEIVSESALSFEGKLQGIPVAEGPGFTVYPVRWEVLPGFTAEGLYIEPEPVGGLTRDAPGMVYLPDAADTPEDVIGLTAKLPASQQTALRFASAGFRILIPAPLDREIYSSEPEDHRLARSQQSHREWIYRQAFQMGRHPLGYEIQAALAGADWLRDQRTSSVTVAGYGEGGRAALYAAAIDSSVDHAFVSGAFASRQKAWSEPIDRNLFRLLPEHGDAEVAALIAPRPLLIEHTRFPEVTDRKGELTTPPFPEVESEFRRIGNAIGGLSAPPSFLLHEANGEARGDFPAVAAFLQTIGVERELSRVPPVALLIDQRQGFDPAIRRQRIFSGMQRHVQSLVDRSTQTREEFFFFSAEPDLRPGPWSVEKRHDTLDPANFIEAAKSKRIQFSQDILGTFDEPLSELNPRSRKIKETEHYIAYDVLLDVYPEMEAWGTLLLPKDQKDGEKRPVVVCQHGRNGIPRDTIDAGKPAYNDFAARLAEEGFITFSPFNLYRGEDEYRWLDRKANLIGGTLFTFITASHSQILTWLKSRPEVDPTRIGFYGLSYGGETAMRVPAVLEDYSFVICSGDFNHWTRKVADPDFPNGFMKSIEWEMPYWNMGNTFDYGEMAGLIFPRPFFVERGHHDGVSVDRWVAFEYARVRRLYALFGIPKKTGITYFRGGHSIDGEESFSFLREYLRFP